MKKHTITLTPRSRVLVADLAQIAGITTEAAIGAIVHAYATTVRGDDAMQDEAGCLSGLAARHGYAATWEAPAYQLATMPPGPLPADIQGHDLFIRRADALDAAQAAHALHPDLRMGHHRPARPGGQAGPARARRAGHARPLAPAG